MELYGDAVDAYLDFAYAARAESPCLADWARCVATDPEVLAWVRGLPDVKQQPNLVFAAARWHGVAAPGPYDGLRAALLGDAQGPIRATVLSRSTQTNEAGRLATLVPALATLPGPLALLEVGASAGLCLYPDRWDYRWTGPSPHALSGSGGPTLVCAAAGPVPYPARHPEVAWRAGVDLHPLDVGDADAMAWLETLVWPEQEARRVRLRHAVEVARSDPPRLVAADLSVDPAAVLAPLLAEASSYGTPVVFHSAVLAYLAPTDRERLVTVLTELVLAGVCHWVSNEGQRVLPTVTATAGRSLPDERAGFVLGVDGRAVAWTHGHGASLTWL